MRVVAPVIVGLVIGVLLVPAPASAQTDPETRIMNAFMRLGMVRDKAYCYGQIIGQILEQEEKIRAVSIVESARDSEAVQQGVMNGGMPMMNAFSAANQTCGS